MSRGNRVQRARRPYPEGQAGEVFIKGETGECQRIQTLGQSTRRIGQNLGLNQIQRQKQRNGEDVQCGRGRAQLLRQYPSGDLMPEQISAKQQAKHQQAVPELAATQAPGCETNGQDGQRYQGQLMSRQQVRHERLQCNQHAASQHNGHKQAAQRWNRDLRMQRVMTRMSNRFSGCQEGIGFIERVGQQVHQRQFPQPKPAFEQHQPHLGVIYWPAGDKLYLAQRGAGAFRRDINGEHPLRVRQLENPESDPVILAISRRQPRERVMQRMNPDRDLSTLPAGSCSLKACLIAEGQADCFLRVGPTGEWDTAAADVIVGEAGGRIVSEHFEPLTYNEEAKLGNPNFLILGDARVAWQDVFIRHRNQHEA